ncbi:hypothetical protein VIM7927_01963 [Vibrio mangrovi]|uniref:Uncharacterized protein n=1 Tax=Vibrio mangrovi TaxID=474394 RepID=A0A1Y6ISS6_9VIBR|nr:hypothetical protein VIM7927_01963 [Vibrio mangrovi]
MVIDDIVTIAVKLGCQCFFRNRHTHGIGNALSQRTGGRFDARRITVLRMARCFRVKLTEILQVIDRQVIASQVQQ